MPISGAN